MKKNYAIVVRGTVQGVGYRYYVKQSADDLGLCGFARNEGDGSVYIEAEGDEESLVLFLDNCHTGPPSAIVDSLEFIESNLSGYSSFSIVSASRSE